MSNMKKKSLLGRINPFGVEMREESAFPEDESYTGAEIPAKCPVIKYDNISYVCIKSSTQQCRGYCENCSFGVRI